MAYSFYSYRVEILQRPFVRSDGFTTKQTAKIDLFNSKGVLITTLSLGVPQMADVYESIGKMDPVNLDYCYIQGFSTLACKRYLQIDKAQPLPIAQFTACNSFFDSSVSVDLSLSLSENEFVIDESYVVTELLDFHLSRFLGTFRLTNCFIKAAKSNFTQARFEGDQVSFKNTILDEGVKDFQDTSFGSGEAIFTNVDFGDGDVSFINAVFNNSDVDFRVCRFGKGKVDFHYARFGGGRVSFERVDFGSGRVDFRAAEFHAGRTSFNRASFLEGELNFEGAETPKGKLTFKRAAFGNITLIFDLYQGAKSEIIFERSLFNQNISFYEAQLGKLIFSDCQFNSTVNLHVKQSDEISLAGCTMRDIVEFYTHGDPPRISSLNLAGARLLGQIYIDWDANGVRNLIYSQGCTTVAEKAEQFRILKENFNALGKYDEEDAAYVEFKRCHMKALLLNSCKQGRVGHLINRITYGAKKLLFDYMGLFATSPQRVILSILVVYVLYSLLYIAIMELGWGHIIATSASGDQLGVVDRGFYFSVVTFFTIGYGDFAPSGIARFVAGTEGFMGVFLMAYFTVAFVRKILR